MNAKKLDEGRQRRFKPGQNVWLSTDDEMHKVTEVPSKGRLVTRRKSDPQNAGGVGIPDKWVVPKHRRLRAKESMNAKSIISKLISEGDSGKRIPKRAARRAAYDLANKYIPQVQGTRYSFRGSSEEILDQCELFLKTHVEWAAVRGDKTAEKSALDKLSSFRKDRLMLSEGEGDPVPPNETEDEELSQDTVDAFNGWFKSAASPSDDNLLRPVAFKAFLAGIEYANNKCWNR
jgi:hypothetical protein